MSPLPSSTTPSPALMEPALTHIPPDTGTTKWQETLGNWAISGGSAWPVFASTVNRIAAYECSDSDVTITSNVNIGTGTWLAVGVAFRIKDATNLWIVDLSRNDNTMYLYDIVGGIGTARGSVVNTFANNTTYQLKVVLSGPSIQVVLNGVTTISYASGVTNQAVTKHGMYVYFHNIAPTIYPHIEDFKVEP